MERENRHTTPTGRTKMKTYNDKTLKKPHAQVSHTRRGLNLGLGLATVLASSFFQWAYAQTKVMSVDASGNDNTAVIKIDLSDSNVKPTAAIAQNRLVVDLPNTQNAAKSTYSYQHTLLKDVKLQTVDGRTRLVFSLNAPTQFKMEQVGNQLMLTLTPDRAKVAATPQAVVGELTQIKNIDFQRGDNGAGRVVIELSDRNGVVDVKPYGGGLVVDFFNTRVPEQLRRNYDVNDFATPVKTMNLSSSSKGGKLYITPKGNWKHSSYQADNRFVIDITPVVTAKNDKPNDKLVQSKYKGQKLSLNFQDIDIRSLMQVFADFTNLNVVVNDNVQGNLTLRLKDIPWDQAFDIVMQTKNLGYKRNGNVIWVAPRDEMLAKEKQELESKAQLADLEPVRTQTIQLNYHKADIVAKGIMGGANEGGGASSSMLSKKGSLAFDTRTNQLFITDLGSKLEEISKFVQKIDVPIRQVMIEARIVEAEDRFGRNLGAKLGFADINGSGSKNNRVFLSGNQKGALQSGGFLPTESGTGLIDLPNTNFVSLPAAGLGGFTPASLGISLFSVGAGALLNLELSALEADGKGKIVSSPKILTTDKQKALIEQGTELPYQAATSSGATSVQFKKANLKLEVTPQITPDGQVFLDVDINKDSPSSITNGSSGLAIDTKHVQTQVLVENGGTVMIGGIFQEDEQSNVTKVPLLGDLPYIGNLFKSTSKKKNRTELLIFLTPKILEDIVASVKK